MLISICRARAQFRKAQLQAKRNEEAAKRKERELLFAGVQEGDLKGGPGRRKGQEKLSQDDLLVNASSDVTAALRRTHQLMQTELSRSQFANETLSTCHCLLNTLDRAPMLIDYRGINRRPKLPKRKLQHPRQSPLLLPISCLNPHLLPEIRYLVPRIRIQTPCIHHHLAHLPPLDLRPG